MMGRIWDSDGDADEQVYFTKSGSGRRPWRW